MKKVFITLFCLSISAAVANAQDKEKTKTTTTTTTTTTTAPVTTTPAAPTETPVDPNAGKFKFQEETHDFGEIPEGMTPERLTSHWRGFKARLWKWAARRLIR